MSTPTATPEPEEKHNSTPIHAPPTHTSVANPQLPTRTHKYQSLRALLANPSKSSELPHTLRALLTDPDLTLQDVRDLFGGLRKSFLQVLWECRQVDLWIKRAKGMGIDYANAIAEDETVAKYPSRYGFFKEMDERLEVGFDGKSGGGQTKEVVELILQHVKVLRETPEEVKKRNEEKERMLGRGKVVVVADC